MIVKYTGGGTQLFRITRDFRYEGTRDLALGPNEEIAAVSVDYVSEATATALSVHVFRPDGTPLWQDRYYDDRHQRLMGVAFDASGNVYLTTEHWACDSHVELVPETGSAATCERGFDSDPERSAILVNKYTPSGSLVWSRIFNKHRPGKDAGTAIAAFSENELYLVGTTANGVNGRARGSGRVSDALKRSGLEGLVALDNCAKLKLQFSPELFYSHSIVPGGLLVMSKTTRFTSGTLLTILFDTIARKSCGRRVQSAVMPSIEETARSATVLA
jgi:hypothetical protein